MARADNEVTREEYEAMLPKRRQQPERAFQERVLKLARLRGWHFWHDNATNAPRRCSACGAIRSGPRNAAGMLDLLLLRRPRLVWVELKHTGNDLTDNQAAMVEQLRACGQEVYVWWPSSWDEIERVLA
jgi:hypothetical protein